MARIHVDLSDTIKTFRKAHSRLTKRKFDRITVQAINHTIRKAKTATSRDIKKTYGAASKDIKKNLHIVRANSLDPSAAIIARGSSLPLRAFSPRQNKRGVSVRIRGKRKIIHKAFIAEMTNGHKGVFARGEYGKGKFNFRKKRLKKNGNDLHINELKTSSVPMMMNNNTILKNVESKMQQDFPVRLAHLLSRAK